MWRIMLFCVIFLPKKLRLGNLLDKFQFCQKIAIIPRLFLPILSAALPIKMSWVFQVMSFSPPGVGDLIAWPPPGPLAHALIATLRQSDGAMAFLITFTQNKFFAMYLKGRAKVKEWGGKRQTGCKSLFCAFRSPKWNILGAEWRSVHDG